MKQFWWSGQSVWAAAIVCALCFIAIVIMYRVTT